MTRAHNVPIWKASLVASARPLKSAFTKSGLGSCETGGGHATAQRSWLSGLERDAARVLTRQCNKLILTQSARSVAAHTEVDDPECGSHGGVCGGLRQAGLGQHVDVMEEGLT